jgi:hypothetical protein
MALVTGTSVYRVVNRKIAPANGSRTRDVLNLLDEGEAGAGGRMREEKKKLSRHGVAPLD